MEHPINFSDEMVLAILAGRKTQTRRRVKFPKNVAQSDHARLVAAMNESPIRQVHSIGPRDGVRPLWRCKYGVPGDLLWVREVYAKNVDTTDGREFYIYRAGVDDNVFTSYRWKPAMFLPRHWSRIRLVVKDIRIERLQDISEEDAMAEGAPAGLQVPARDWYSSLWDSLYRSGGCQWEDNPYVWRIEFSWGGRTGEEQGV